MLNSYEFCIFITAQRGTHSGPAREKRHPSMTCINCQHEHDGRFCPNCGERTAVPNITFRSIFNEGLSTLTNMDKGFLFNVKNLVLNPKKTAVGYVEGRRKSIFNPVSFLILSVTIYLIADPLIVVEVESSRDKSKVYSAGLEAGRFVKSYFKYFWILSVVWLSNSTRLLFGKYNYAEHLAINAFVLGQATLAGLLFFLITKMVLPVNPFVYLTIVWMTYKIFADNRKHGVGVFLSIGATALFLVQLFVILAVIALLKSQA